MVLLGLLMDGGHWGPRPSQKLASLQPLSSLHLSPLRRVQPDVQQGPWKQPPRDERHCPVTEDGSNQRKRKRVGRRVYRVQLETWYALDRFLGRLKI